MDYTKSKTAFKVRKLLRYIRLYGISRTLAKVRAQYHVNRRFETMPKVSADADWGSIGLIGCGNYAYSTIAYYLNKHDKSIIRGAMDTDINKAASLFERYKLCYYTDDPHRIPGDESIRLVYIASNHASHAEYAIDCLRAGKSVHIEKPHAVSLEQLKRLCRAMEDSEGAVNLGFNRPHSRIGQAIRRHLWSQSGPSMLNWFVAGHELPADHWYFSEAEGGRVLGNLCHWTDFIYQMIPPENRYPITIRPTRAAQSDCDIAVTYTFGDGSIGAITFSAKGHTFEGVRERFAAHRGNVLVSMDDFQTLRVDEIDKKHRYDRIFRDHGHRKAIINSLLWSIAAEPKDAGLTTAYVWETGELVLKTREALEKGVPIELQPYDRSRVLGD